MRYRSLTRSSGPAVEPVTVAEAKAHLRVDISDDDAYIGTLITAAREWVEAYLDRTLVNTQWVMRLDSFPIGDIELPRPPMVSSGTATSVTMTYAYSGSVTAVLSSSVYRVDRNSTPGVVRPLYNSQWPPHVNDANAVAVTWWAGYGSSGSSVPASIRHAMLMLIGFWYENRGAVLVGSISKQLEFAVESLLSTQKWGGYA